MNECLDLIKEDLKLLPKRLEGDDKLITSQKCKRLIEELEVQALAYEADHNNYVYELPAPEKRRDCVTLLKWQNEPERGAYASHYPVESIAAMAGLYNELNLFVKALPKNEPDAKNKPPANAAQDEPKIPDYVALDLSKRTVTIGADSHIVTSEKVWDFLKDLCSARRDDRLVSRNDGVTNNKNNVDQLRKQIRKSALHKVILFMDGGYKLNPEVKILEGGQVGIRKTHLSR